MTLALDIGNQVMLFGLFGDGKLAATFRLSAGRERTKDELAFELEGMLALRGFSPSVVSGSVIGSVVPAATDIAVRAFETVFGLSPLVVDSGVKTGIKIKFESPKEIGADRIACAVAAKTLFGTPAIVVDFGTAIAFDAISSDGEYVGGTLFPGPLISSDALSSHAARIIRTDMKKPVSVIGKTTQDALRAGLCYGYADLVSGLVSRISGELGGKPVVIAAGDIPDVLDASLLAVDHREPDLALKGLHAIHCMNRGTTSDEKGFKNRQ